MKSYIFIACCFFLQMAVIAQKNLKNNLLGELDKTSFFANKIIGEMSYDFLCCDNGNDSIYQISKTGEIVWSYPASNCQDIWALPNGKYLVYLSSRGQRARRGY